MSKINKTLVANMQHVKTNLIPPRSGPNPQGLNVPTKQVKTNETNLNEQKSILHSSFTKDNI